MKVTNNKIGGTPGNMDSARTGRSEGAGALSKEIKSGVSKANLKDSAQVNVSERAQMMQKAKDIASGPMTVDEAKVARLQKMIDEGKYKVDADSIADRLVEEHLTIPD